MNFNSHPRVGGDFVSFYVFSWYSYFNSHPRVGGDSASHEKQNAKKISTHTPAWGVT